MDLTKAKLLQVAKKMPRPTGDWVLIRRITGEQVSKGGIIVAEVSANDSVQAEVLACGPGIWEDGARVPMNTKVGDRVLFLGEALGFFVDGEQFFGIRDPHCIMVIETKGQAS